MKKLIFLILIFASCKIYFQVPTEHAWANITGKPEDIQLGDALKQLDYLPIPEKTTIEISAMKMTGIALVKDKTLGVLKYWNGSTWLILSK